MDEWLSQVYGTGQSDDIEKTAQNMMLSKLAEEEGIDLSGLSADELDALAQAVVSEDGGQEQHSEQYDDGATGGEEELQAKFAEADFLGRVMAHAYTQELQKIAQEESAAEEAAEEKKCAGCGKEKEECVCPHAEKTASAGPITRAIHRLGGTVGDNSSAYIEKMAEARAEELAIGWLQENGYLR